MENGVATFPTHDAMVPGTSPRLVEERGQGSLFFAEHTHIPASRISPFPGGGELPRKYWNTYDLFVTLTAAAMATTSLRVGSGICLVDQRDPIVTAKEVASIDHMSGGRLSRRGRGWNREEMENHGTDPRKRIAHGGVGRGDEGDLDPGRGDVRRPARLLRSHLVLAEARAASAPAGPGRRPRSDGARPRAGLRRRMVPVPVRRAARPGRRAAPPSGGAGAHRDRRRRGRSHGPVALEQYLEAGVDRVLFELPAAGRGPVERRSTRRRTRWRRPSGRR